MFEYIAPLTRMSSNIRTASEKLGHQGGLCDLSAIEGPSLAADVVLMRETMPSYLVLEVTHMPRRRLRRFFRLFSVCRSSKTDCLYTWCAHCALSRGKRVTTDKAAVVDRHTSSHTAGGFRKQFRLHSVSDQRKLRYMKYSQKTHI